MRGCIKHLVPAPEAAPACNGQHRDKFFDLAIIGAGISSAYTLIHYISLLEKRRPSKPVKVVVFERSGEFWSGIPYGKRSGVHSLLISSLREFLPQAEEREAFAKWLSKNRDWVFEKLTEGKWDHSSAWLRRNRKAMAEGRWDDLFLPRYTFGLYLQERVAKLLRQAARMGILECDLVAADVLDVQQIGSGFRVDISCESGDCESVRAGKVILALGSPPNCGVKRANGTNGEREVCFFENMYEPSLDANIERIGEVLERSDEKCRRVLIAGTNASALEALYCLKNSRKTNALIDEFVLVSPSVEFPHRIVSEGQPVNFSPQHLTVLLKKRAVQAKQILDAVRRDVARASAQNVNIASIFCELSKAMLQALEQLNVREQKRFVSKYGAEIGRMQRRAGAEYLNVVDTLSKERRIEMRKGRIIRFISTTKNGVWIEVGGRKILKRKVFIPGISVFICCAGFKDVSKPASTLMRNLILRKICVPNDSNRGFLINERFEAQKNLFVMGPLVAGNLAGKIRVWHAESCSRIIGLSKQLAELLMEDSCRAASGTHDRRVSKA